MQARNLAAKTIGSYLDSAEQLAAHAGVDDVPDLTRDHIRRYLADLTATGRKATTVSFRFRSLQQWFKWLHDEDEIDDNPMAGMDPPIVPEQPVDVVSLEQMRVLLKVCEGRTFAERRDTAILRLFLDAGVRLDEMASMTMAGTDVPGRTAQVLGKGRRERTVPFGSKTALALDRYLRVRVRHTHADLPALWLGAKGKGALTGNGVYQMVKRRAAGAGLKLHPHQFRHTAAHQWLAEGGGEGDLMMIMGWRSRSMLQRYGASAAAERARDAHRRLGLGDRI